MTDEQAAVEEGEATQHESMVVHASRPLRLFMACSPRHGYVELAAARGPVEAIESEALRGAPVGALLLTDLEEADDRGVVCAERALAGWVLLSGAGT